MTARVLRLKSRKGATVFIDQQLYSMLTQISGNYKQKHHLEGNAVPARQDIVTRTPITRV